MSKRQIQIISIITVFVACLPLFTVNCIGGHDIAYHLLRIESLKTGILNGLPFLRINMLYFGGAGYAGSLFYPDLFLYIPALLRVAGVGINLSYHIFIGFCITAGFLSALYCTYAVSGDTDISLITAMIFTLFKYHIYDIYTRGAIGEITAMIFVPFVIAGIYDLIFNRFKRPQLLIIGMAGVILCHTLTTFFCVVFCVAAVAVYIKRLYKNKRLLVKLILAALIVALMTAFYVLPMLEMMFSASFRLSEAFFDLNNEKLLIRNIFETKDPSLGTVIFVPLILRIFIKRIKEDELMGFADFAALSGVLAALFTTGILPWDRLMNHFSFVQFPWRLFILAGPLLAFADSVYIIRFIRRSSLNNTANTLAVLTVLAAMSLTAVNCVENSAEPYYSYSNDYFEYAPFTAEVIGGEWLPATVTDRDELIYSKDTAYDEDGNGLKVGRVKNTLYVENVPEDVDYLDVPFIYYKGYAASDENGEPLYIDGSGNNGKARVYPKGSSYVRVYYKGTPVQKISWLISAVFYAGVIINMIWKKKKDK